MIDPFASIIHSRFSLFLPSPVLTHTHHLPYSVHSTVFTSIMADALKAEGNKAFSAKDYATAV